MKHSGNKFSPWRIYLAGGVVCAALGAGAYAVGFSPATLRHARQAAKQTELRARKHKAANLAGQLNTARTQLTAITDSFANLPLRLEPATQVNQRLARLTDLANGAGLTIDEMRPGAIADGPDFKTVPILIAGNGTYPACAKFLHALRETFPDTAVLSFNTTNNSASPESPAATFQFDLAWHAAKG